MTSWVVGSGGLLGSAVRRELRRRRRPTLEGVRIDWAGPGGRDDLADGVDRLIASAGESPWRIYWCAGAGVTASSAGALQGEVSAFGRFIDLLAALRPDVLARGSLFVASSAGAVYAGSVGAPFDEGTAPVPISDYGRAKLDSERIARDFGERTGVPTVIGRIANLYGPGQSLTKAQGLVSHLCLATVHRRPLTIYVPFDTLRDYVYVDDCAAMIVDAADAAESGARSGMPFARVKILASGRAVSVAGLVGEFTRVAGRRPDLVTASSAQTGLQSKDLRMRSTALVEVDRRTMTTLPEGIHRTLQSIRSAVLSGTR